MFKLTDGRSSAYQWDTSLYVDCTGLAESDEVHFCRPGITLALHPAMQGETLAAPVPDELLQQAQPIIVFAYVQTATGEITRASTRLCVIARPKPPGYIASPTDALRWENLQEQIGDLDDLHTQDKTNLVAAVNEAMTQGGAADPEAVQQIVENYLAENPPTVTETDPTVPEWAKAAQKPSYTASEVGADPSGAAASQVSAHNTGTDTHSDIRLLISGLTDRLNTLADSDDTTLDQLSEVVAYIKSNRELIAAITTDKVSVADIVNNLTTNVANKPLSAAQGVALKALIDAITVPDKLPNPNALTFTGAVDATYDGSAPVNVEIPSGGGRTLALIADVTTSEETNMISITQDSDGNPFSIKSWAAYIYIPAHERAEQKTFYARGASYGGGIAFSNKLTTQNKAIGFFLYPIANYDAQDALDAGHPLRVQYISSYGANAEDASVGFGINMSIFQVYTNNAEVLFPAGVRVRLWGVRI